MNRIKDISIPNSSLYFIISILFFALGFYYLSFYNLPKGDFYIPNDEFMITDSGVFAWYGLPSRCLEWPASPMVLFYYVLIGIFAVSSFITQTLLGNSSLNFFEVFDIEVYNYLLNKPAYLVYGRIFQFIVVVVLAVLSFKNFKKSSLFSSNILGLQLFFGILLGSQTLISTTSLVRPDSIAILLTVYFFSIAFSNDFDRFSQKILVVIVFAFLVSFRTVYLFLAPYLFYIIFIKKSKISFRSNIFLLVLFFVLLLTLNPYLLTNSFLFMKAFLGNIISKRHQEMNSFYNKQFIINEIKQNIFIPFYTIFAGLGIFSLWKNVFLPKIEICILIGLSLFYLHSTLSAPVVFTTHIAPLLPFFYVLVAIGISILISKKSILFYPVFFIILFSNIYVNYNGSRKGNPMNYFEAINWLKSENIYKSMAIPEQWDVLFAESRNKKSFELEYDLLNNMERRSNKLNKLFPNKNEQKSSFDTILLQSFMFDEENIKSAAANISIHQTPENKPNTKMVYLFDDNSDLPENAISPLHCQTYKEIETLIKENKIDILLTKSIKKDPNFELLMKFDQGLGDVYFVYNRKP